MQLPRIRQLVFASNDVEDIDRLRTILGLGTGFVDPGVAVFGLTNGVFALGDQFLEVVVPVEDQTAAGRFLERGDGVGGYMAIFQTDDLERVRSYADENRIRRVWDIDVEDISASHLHPADIGAAIVSIDEARPASSWRWGGPDWTSNAVPGSLSALEIHAVAPQTLSARWASVLGVTANHLGHEIWEIPMSAGGIRVVPGARDHLSAYTLTHPDPESCLNRAADLGFAVTGQGFKFAGVHVLLLAN